MLIGTFIDSLSELQMSLPDKAELQRALRMLTDENHGLTKNGTAFLMEAAEKMPARGVKPHDMAAVLASPIMSRRPAPVRADPFAEVIALPLRQAS